MLSKSPKISIGLAVYNGEKFLELAINSILAQTFTDFELIICDNASTDRTPEICEKYAHQDFRVRYYRNSTNIGGANNENLTFKLAQGSYFRWAAHDDICAPDLLEKLVSVLDSDPAVVLAHSKIMKIDENGQQLGILDQDKASTGSPSSRFRSLIGWDHDCEATYGLIRSEVMNKTELQRNYTDSDRTFLAQLSLFGKFHQVPEVLFFKRIHPEMSTQVYQDWRERMAWFGQIDDRRILLPHWMQFTHYFEIIGSAPIPLWEKLRCYAYMIRWIFWYKRWRSMANDILLAIEKFLRIRLHSRASLK